MISVIDGTVYVGLAYLKSSGVSTKTIEKWSGTDVYKIGRGKDALYQLDTLPNQSRAKLPTENELLALYHSKRKDDLESELFDSLKYAQSARCNHYQKVYRNEYKVEINKSLRMAMKAAAWQRVLEHYTERSTGSKGGIQRGFVEALYSAYIRLYPKSYAPAAFSRAIKHAKEKGVTEFCYDGRLTSNKQGHNTKFDDRHLAMLLGFFMPGKGFKAPYILKMMQSACAAAKIPCPKSTWVKDKMRFWELNPAVYEKRYGKLAADKKIAYVSLLPAEYAGNQYQLDGWVMDFLYQDKGSKGEVRWRRPIYNAVFDNHSKKIVGHCVTHTENREAVLEALEDAVKNTGGLPMELVSDNHSFNQTKELTNFKAMLESIAVTWTVSSNPRQKLTAESSFKYITEQITKLMGGSVGLSITSKSKAARPSQEEIDKYMQASHRLSFEEIQAMGVQITETWNNQTAPGRSSTPNKLFASSPKPFLRKVDELDRLRIFTKQTEYKVANYQITINIGGRKEYVLPVKFSNYNGRNVVVRYASLDEIYLFEPKTDQHICTLKQKRKAHGALADQTEEDFEIMNQSTALRKAVMKKGKQEVGDVMRNAENMQPGILHNLNEMTTPKSVLQWAQESDDNAMALRAKGIDVQRIPINKKTSSLNYQLPDEDTKQAKNRNRPYHNPNHVMTEITYTDL